MQNAYSEPTTSAQAIIDDLNSFPASEIFDLEKHESIMRDLVAGEYTVEEFHVMLQETYVAENHGDTFDFYTEIAPFLLTDDAKSKPTQSISFGGVDLDSLSVWSKP